MVFCVVLLLLCKGRDGKGGSMFVLEAVFDDAVWRGGVPWTHGYEHGVDVR